MSAQEHDIRCAAVIGAGNMGAGIAAHLANAGIPVLLLDRPAEGAERSQPARHARDQQLAAGGFMHPTCAELVETGNIEDDLHRLAEADWIIEAVFEDAEIKRALYRDLEAVRKPGSVVSSNTSTIPLAALIDGLGGAFAEDFAITHFFNPPRRMLLVELVGGEHTTAQTLARLEEVCDRRLGKTVIRCRDTPGFIANRVGNYWMSVAALEASAGGLTVEEADAVMGRPFGIPRTGIFGLLDFVGLNLVPLVWGSFMRTLPDHDAHRAHDLTTDRFVGEMIAQGRLGRRVGAGFYRTRVVEDRKVHEAIDFGTGEYRPVRDVDLPGLRESANDLRTLCESEDRAGRYAWAVLSALVSYASEIAPEIASDVASVDVAMKLGYNWSSGPFELADSVGPAWIAKRLAGEGRPIPEFLSTAITRGGFYDAAGRGLETTGRVPAANTPGADSPLSVARRSSRVDGTDGASLWDLGEGILGLEVHTKMNACDTSVVDVVERATSVVSGGFRALVIGNEHPRAFSAGADLGTFLAHCRAGRWQELSEFVQRGQRAWLGLRTAPFPVVAAPFGFALGGGNELQMHCDVSVAHAELSAGLPEIAVGIVPGWGGCLRLLERFTDRNGGDPVEGARCAFHELVDPRTTTSARHAVDRGFLRSTDPIVMNRDRLVGSAREVAIELVEAGYQPAPRPTWLLGGQKTEALLLLDMAQFIDEGRLSGHDVEVARVLARILSGGDPVSSSTVTDEDMLRLELEGMVALSHTEETQRRMEETLTGGRRR